jgi:repressor LexA
MKGLSKKQREVLDFVKEFIETHRYAPSYREISVHFGFSSLGTVYNYMQILRRKGLIDAQPSAARSLFPTEQTPPSIKSNELVLPYLGHVKAGEPIETFPQSQSIAVPSHLVHNPDRTYVFRIHGEGFHDELIADGDFIVVEARQEACSGETVLGVLHGHETIIKKYFPEGGYVRLCGQLAQRHPQVIRGEELQIQGTVVGLLRAYG